jgi:glycolate oxidase FAD binding subunit
MSGPLRLLYGTLRDLALGVEAVDAQGQALKFGGVTVKNVSGYDITKFLIGSAGSLCIVTRIATRIYPVAEAACLCTADLPGVEELEGIQEDLLASVLIPSALVAFPRTDDGEVRLLAVFEGHPKAVERQHRDLAEMVRQRGGRCEVSMERGALKGALGDSVDPPEVDGTLVGVRAAVPLTRGPEALQRAHEVAKEMGLQFKGALLCGTGVLCLYGAALEEGALIQWMGRIRRTAEELGGTANPLFGPRKVLELWGPRVKEEIQRLVLSPIKAKLDPKGVLPPLF